MNDMALGELHARNLEAAERLARLSIEHSLGVMVLLSALARELHDLNVVHVRELAQVGEAEALHLRTQHLAVTTLRLVDGARRIAELGSGVRAAFSRLLTEQLASGSHGLMEAFQAFFAVLPVQNVDLPQMMQLALERGQRAFDELASVLAQATTEAPPAASKKKPRAPAKPAAPPVTEAAAA